MMLVEKVPTECFFVRDAESGKYMGFDVPTTYWKREHAEFAIKRQQTRRNPIKIKWEIIRVAIQAPMM